MVREIIKINTDRGLDTRNPSFHGIELSEYTYRAIRMGMPAITASLMWDKCLDSEWTKKEYGTLLGSRFYIRHTPTSEKTNADTRYKYDLQFKSEREELLTNVYFYDTVYSKSLTEDKPCSNSTVFKFYGNITECVDRLNAAFRYAGIGDSILKTNTHPAISDVPKGDGYYAVIDPDGLGDIETTYEFDFENQSLWEAITQFYEKTGVMFEFKGRKMIWNAYHRPIDHEFAYGADNELLSVKKTNANAKVINRITMLGSSENIPYYYPNETEYGHIRLVFGQSNKILSASSVAIENYSKFLRHVRADQKIEGIYEGGYAYLKVGDVKYSDFAKLGLKTTVPVNAAIVGETIGWETEYQLPYQTKLMPPIYRSSKGAERFYNAENDKYKIGDEYLNFPNPFIEGSPSEHIFEDEKIKPTIEGIKNENGELFGEILEVAFDENDNDDLKVVGEDGDALQYQHSYFYIKLNIFNGKYGFNLFDRHSQTDAMTIQMTSGNCNGCKFKIQAVEKIDEGGFNYYENPVQTTGANGNIAAGDYEQKVNKDNIQSWQQNTETNSIWVCVQKDVETFGEIYPSQKKGIVPKGRTSIKEGDTFNIINIDLPQEYVDAAEERLMNDGLECMAENNEEKFTFSVSASRIFFAENPDILAQLDEYSIIKLKYNNILYELFINSFTINCKNNEALPEIQFELTDTIKVGESFVSQVAAQAAALIPSPSKNAMTLYEADRRFLSKLRPDRTPYDLAIGGTTIAEGDIRSKEFAEGIAGGFGWKGDKEGHFLMRSLRLFEFLEVPELRYNRTTVTVGNQWIAPGAGIVEEFHFGQNFENQMLGTINLKLESGEFGSLVKGDICMGIWHFESGNSPQDEDDGKGNFQFRGFRTIYFVVESVLGQSNELVNIRTRQGYLNRPQQGMHIVAYGNNAKNKDGSWQYPERQISAYISRNYFRFLKDVTDYEFKADNIAMQFGDLSNLRVFDIDMQGYSAYLHNVYFDGVIKQLKEMPLIQWECFPSVIHCDAQGRPLDKGVTVRVWHVQGAERELLNVPNGGVWEVRFDVTTDEGHSSDKLFETSYIDLTDSDAHPKYEFRVIDTDTGVVISEYEIGNVCDGQQGADGPQGPQGPAGQSIQGPQGGVIRIRGAFQSGPKYYAGDEDVNGVRWVDVVWVDNAEGTDRNYYVCRKTGFYDSSNGPTYSSARAGWEAFSYINALLTDLIIANQGKVKFLNSNEIVFGEDDGTIWGRIGSPSNGLPIMWLGGPSAYNATTVMTKDGMARFGTYGGNRIELDPIEKEIRIYDEQNRNVVQIDGKAHDLDAAYDCVNTLDKTAYNPSKSFYGEEGNRTTVVENLGFVSVGPEGAHLTTHVDYKFRAYTAYRAISPDGRTPATQAIGSVSIDLGVRRIGNTAWVDHSGEKELSGESLIFGPAPSVDTNGMAYKSSTSSGYAAFNCDLKEGNYEVVIIIEVYNPTITNWNGGTVNTYGNNVVTLSNYSSKFKAGNAPKAFLGTNGLIVANSTQDYAVAGMRDGKWTIELVSDGMGMRFRDGNIYATDSNGVFRKIRFEYED